MFKIYTIHVFKINVHMKFECQAQRQACCIVGEVVEDDREPPRRPRAAEMKVLPIALAQRAVTSMEQGPANLLARKPRFSNPASWHGNPLCHKLTKC
jgi:hypothetical protein